MSKIYPNFIALPKEYRYPEDLEEGIFFSGDSLTVIYDAKTACYHVTTECIEKNEQNETRTVVKITRCVYKFSLENYFVFYNGRLVNNDREIDIQH